MIGRSFRRASDKNFQFHRMMLGGFNIYYGKGKQGEQMVLDIPKAVTRAEHTNVFAVTKGWCDVTGPEVYGTKRFTAGQMGLDLPDYPTGGAYAFRPGPEGLEFFCITTYPKSNNYKFITTRVKAGGQYVVEKSHIFAICFGKIAVGSTEIAVPTVVDASGIDKMITAVEPIIGLEVWMTL